MTITYRGTLYQVGTEADLVLLCALVAQLERLAIRLAA